MFADPRKRAAVDADASCGPGGKKAMSAENTGQSPKEQPMDDPQEGQSQNNGVPPTAHMNNSGPTNARNNEDGSAEDFIESTTARRYGVWINADAYDGQSGRFVNKDTSEVLIVRLYGTDGTARSVEVERKPMDDE